MTKLPLSLWIAHDFTVEFELSKYADKKICEVGVMSDILTISKIVYYIVGQVTIQLCKS